MRRTGFHLAAALAAAVVLNFAAAHALQPPSDPQAAADATQDDATSSQTFRDFASIFDPSRKRWLWVLPPGVTAKGAEPIKITVKLRGELKLATEIPVRAVHLGPADRKEIPEGHTGVLLVDAGQAEERIAEVERTVNAIVALYGRGHSDIEFENFVPIALSEAAKQKYCGGNREIDLRLYIDEVGVEALQEMAEAVTFSMRTRALDSACAEWRAAASNRDSGKPN